MTDAALLALIENYCQEAGVRNLQKHIEKIYRKVFSSIHFSNIVKDVSYYETSYGLYCMGAETAALFLFFSMFWETALVLYYS